MRILLTTLLMLIVARSVLDPAAGVTVLQGLLLIGLGLLAINWLVPRRGLSLGSLIAFHLITRRNRKERRHVASATPMRSHTRAIREARRDSRRKAA